MAEGLGEGGRVELSLPEWGGTGILVGAKLRLLKVLRSLGL